MTKKLLFITLFMLGFLAPANCVSALEGLVKFSQANKIVFLEVAVTDEEKSKGLMNRTLLAENRGMVFVFRPERTVTFWMKDTLISLDMIFVRYGKIVHIVKNAIPNQTQILYPSEFPVTEVIEVNGGFSDANMIEIGSQVEFENISHIEYSMSSKLMIIPRQ